MRAAILRKARESAEVAAKFFDENAAAHIALGNAVLPATPEAVDLGEEDRRARGINVSSIHTDFMIGSPEVDIWGVDADGNETPILSHGDWVLT